MSKESSTEHKKKTIARASEANRKFAVRSSRMPEPGLLSGECGVFGKAFHSFTLIVSFEVP
ncbi:MAG: hypothetical protein ACRER2_00465 [Methylococcales bacterium]